MTPFAIRIQTLRRARGWTQAQLAQAAGLTRSHVSRLERGDIRLPARPALARLALALGTTLDDLLVAAEYLPPADPATLPRLAEYLRRKYGLTPAGCAVVEAALTALRARTEGEIRD